MMICLPRDEKNFDAIEKLLQKRIPVIDNPLPSAAAQPEGSDADEKRHARSRSRKIDRRKPQSSAAGEALTAAMAPLEVQTPAVTPVAADLGIQAFTTAPQNAQESRKSREPRRAPRDKGRRNDGSNDPKVVGLGDHLPEFIALSFKDR
jgi:ATP-dependent RNA helicase RhlE